MTALAASYPFSGSAIAAWSAFVVCLVAGYVGGFLLSRYLKARAIRRRRLGRAVLSLLDVVLARTSIWAGVIVGLRFGVLFLPVLPGVTAMVHMLASCGVVVLLAKISWDLASIPGNLLRRAGGSRQSVGDDHLADGLVSALRLIVMAVFVPQLLQVAAGEVLSLVLVALSLAGLAIAIAFRDLLRDLAGTFQLLLSRPFGVGDRIRWGTHEGVVEAFGTLTTRVRQTGGELAFVPNAELARAGIANVDARPFIRRSFAVALPSSLRAARLLEALRVVQATVADHEGQRADRPPQVHLSPPTGETIEILVTLWFHPPRVVEASAEVERLLLILHDRLEAYRTARAT